MTALAAAFGIGKTIQKNVQDGLEIKEKAKEREQAAINLFSKDSVFDAKFEKRKERIRELQESILKVRSEVGFNATVSLEDLETELTELRTNPLKADLQAKEENTPQALMETMPGIVEPPVSTGSYTMPEMRMAPPKESDHISAETRRVEFERTRLELILELSSILEGATATGTGANSLFDTLLERAAGWSSKHALEYGVDFGDPTDFGVVRDVQKGAYTPFIKYPIAWLLLCHSFVERFPGLVKMLPAALPFERAKPALMDLLKPNDFLANSTSGLLYLNTDLTNAIYLFQDEKGLILQGQFMVHASPEPALSKAKEVFGKIMQLDRPVNLEQFHILLGELHFYLGIAMPYKRGSAAITEVLIEAVVGFFGAEIIYPSRESIVALFNPSEVVSLFASEDAQTLYGEMSEKIEGGRSAIDQLIQGSVLINRFMELYKNLTELRYSDPNG